MKKIVVSGASRGIGREIVLNLVNKGHYVIALARSKEALNELKNVNPELIEIFSCDLTIQNQVDELSSKTEHHTFDGIVNNAGTLINKPFMNLNINEWKQQLDANLYSAIRLIKACKARMNKSSHIVNISSMGGFQGSSKFPGLSAYSVSKGGLSILSECMAAEFADDSISVNCLCLGAVQTEMLQQAFPGFDAPVSAEQMGNFISRFILTGHQFFNGKVLPVALNDPN